MSDSGDEGGYVDAQAEDSEQELLEEYDLAPEQPPDVRVVAPCDRSM